MTGGILFGIIAVGGFTILIFFVRAILQESERRTRGDILRGLGMGPFPLFDAVPRINTKKIAAAIKRRRGVR